MDFAKKITKEGRLRLMPVNKEPNKSVKEVTPAFKKIAKYMINNKFAEVLN
jgi:hypothetical protein